MIRTYFKLAKISIKENKVRSFLTCLGIAIGIASIILILSLTNSVTNLIANQFKEIGSDLIIVRPTSEKGAVSSFIEELTSANSFLQSSLTLNDVEKIKEIENVSAVAPLAISTHTISIETNQLDSVTIMGTNEDFIKIQPLSLKYGMFLNSELSEKTAVIGHGISMNLFSTQNPVGKTLTIMGEKFMVIGVMSRNDESVNLSGVDFENSVIVMANALKEVDDSIQIQQINVKASNEDSLETVSQAINEKLLEEKSGDKNFAVMFGDGITHPANSLLSIVSGILTLVAGISLIVGGIGVMNIMLVAVSERTQEIGIRKAVGASTKDVMMQFLIESSMLSFVGGILGILLGYVIAIFIATMTPFKPYTDFWILFVSMVLSILIGMLFGVYPAAKAALQDPIDSLKHYR